MVGEPESRSAQERIKHGIPIQNDVIGLLKAEADKLGISFPHPIDNT
jgi:LDH2 family malate/lactate/ureidoglycolate dehydrogenase